MFEQEPKPPYTNESIPPPPEVNRLCSRIDKSLKAKKTKRTMNPNSKSTMRHIEMLSKSSDVNFKNVVTRSGSKGNEYIVDSDEMDDGDEAERGMEVQKDMSADMLGSETISTEELMSGISCDENVSVLFPEMNTNCVAKNNASNSGVSSVFPDVAAPLMKNFTSNPELAKDSGINSILDDKKAVDSDMTGMTTRTGVEFGDGSSNKDVEIKEDNNMKKPMSFSSVVQGNYFGGNNKLKLVPCVINNEGRKVVDMDPIIVEGSKKWDLTVVGYFVGFKMSFREIVGHLKRMWRQFQLDKIIFNESGIYFFKFRSEEGIQNVIENGPWLVDQKPLFVQRWEAGQCLHKPEPTKIPLWVRIYNIPLEAWNMEGISRIASRIGTPIIMDRTTATMCELKFGRASFARVLVEVDAANGIVDSVELWYKELGRSMDLKVEYAWLPPVCSHCCVFGHNFKGCNNRVLTDAEKIDRMGVKVQASVKSNLDHLLNNGWKSMQNRKATNGFGNIAKSQAQQVNVNGVAEYSSTHLQHNNQSGVGNMRNGTTPSSGGASIRGRGNLYGRGGYSGMNVNNERSNVPIKSNGKGENLMSEEMKKQGIEKDNKTNDAHLNHATLKEFRTSNSYSVLDGEETNEESDEWKNFCARIDMSCKKGIMIDEDEKLSWSAKMLDYYSVRSKKCNEKAIAADVGLKNRIDMLKKSMSLGAKVLHENAKKSAEQRIIHECDGIRIQSSYNLFYSQAYEAELKKIKQMKWQKDMLEVDLFINSKQSLTESIKELWSNDMVKYYENVCDIRRNDRTDAHCCE